MKVNWLSATALLVGAISLGAAAGQVGSFPRPRFEKLLSEKNSEETPVRLIEVWHDKETGQEFTRVITDSPHNVNAISCFPTGRIW